MKTLRILVLAFGLLLAAGILIARDDSPASQPASATKPSAKVSAEARLVLDDVAAAYAKVKSLNLTGNLSLVLKFEGEAPDTHEETFTSTFAAPNRFRHESKEDVLLGSTGAKLYTFRTQKNAYTLADAPKDHVPSDDLPRDLAGVLATQNPSLLLAIARNASDELLDGVELAAKASDTLIDGQSFQTLKFEQNDGSTVIAIFDPQTHLLRRQTTDLTQPLKKRRPDLLSAILTTDYTNAKVDQPSKDESFAWSPPAGAIDADAAASAHPLDAVAASDLEGKPAPAFKLPTLEGKTVSLASLKGHVVVLDFWATWCGPCRESLPHLGKLHQEEKEHGVEVFAINQQEEQKDVEEFVAQTKLAVPVLLDRDGLVGTAYGVEGIPQTVVIGKDGKIQKVFEGFGPELPDLLKKAVDAANKQ